jgi:hypothetical protein
MHPTARFGTFLLENNLVERQSCIFFVGVIVLLILPELRILSIQQSELRVQNRNIDTTEQIEVHLVVVELADFRLFRIQI